MLIFYIIKYIITHKNKILYRFFMYYLLPTIKKVKKDSNPYPIRIRIFISITPSVPNYKSFQKSWRVNIFQV